MTNPLRIVFPVLAAGLAVATGCGDKSSHDALPAAHPLGATQTKHVAQPPASAPKATPGYPSSIAVLGHSGATGENSDPNRPHEEVRANSWATGANPAVKSIYLRVLARNPAIKGHSFNLAQGGATVDDLLAQTAEAVKLKPQPELFLVQIMDNDIVCPRSEAALKSFRVKLVSALAVLAKSSARAKIFVVSQFGSPTTGVKTLSDDERVASGGDGPCDPTDPNGRVRSGRIAVLESAIHGYEAQLKAGCRRFATCRYDGGAFGDIVDKRIYMSNDLNHFSIRGHAEAAAAAWKAMKRTALIPRS